MPLIEAPTERGTVRRLFYGSAELRAGWRLCIFAAIVLGLRLVRGLVVDRLSRRLDPDTLLFITLLLTIGILLFASAVMAKLEGRKIADYGLPPRRMFSKQFWQGTLIGFATITALMAALRVAGAVSFAAGNPQGPAIWMHAVLYGLFFVLGGVFEEFFFRGYAVFTLSTGIGFWPAALVSSTLFGALHYFSPGETAYGTFAAELFGLLQCLLLRRTGDLWMPIGLHASYNWGESFFYGAPDSGSRAPAHLLTAVFSGPDWLTGGSAGPEGSALCIPIILVVAILVVWRLRETKYPDAAALRKSPPNDPPASGA